MKPLGLIINGSLPFCPRSPTLLGTKLRTPHSVTMSSSSRPKAAKLHCLTYTSSPSLETDLHGDPSDGPSEKVIAAEEYIERVIYRCRFLSMFGVAGSLLGSVLCFLKGCVYVSNSFKVYFGSGGKVMLMLVEAIDMYLIGTVLLVFGMGLYELFISNLDISNTSSEGSNFFGFFKLVDRPEWLEIQSLDELKTKLGNVIVTVLLVGMLDKCKKVSITTSTDLLCLAISILLCSACLYLLSRLHTPKRGSHVPE